MPTPGCGRCAAWQDLSEGPREAPGAGFVHYAPITPALRCSRAHGGASAPCAAVATPDPTADAPSRHRGAAPSAPRASLHVASSPLSSAPSVAAIIAIALVPCTSAHPPSPPCKRRGLSPRGSSCVIRRDAQSSHPASPSPDYPSSHHPSIFAASSQHSSVFSAFVMPRPSAPSPSSAHPSGCGCGCGRRAAGSGSRRKVDGGVGRCWGSSTHTVGGVHGRDRWLIEAQGACVDAVCMPCSSCNGVGRSTGSTGRLQSFQLQRSLTPKATKSVAMQDTTRTTRARPGHTSDTALPWTRRPAHARPEGAPRAAAAVSGRRDLPGTEGSRRWRCRSAGVQLSHFDAGMGRRRGDGAGGYMRVYVALHRVMRSPAEHR